MRNVLVLGLSVLFLVGCGSDGGGSGSLDARSGTGGQGGGTAMVGTGGAAAGTGGAGRDAAAGTGGATSSGGATTKDAAVGSGGRATGGVPGTGGAAGAGGGPGQDGAAIDGLVGLDGAAGTGGVDASLGMGGVGGCACTGGASGANGFARTGTMVQARTMHVATVLGDGKVLITGGGSSGPYSASPLASAEIFDPDTSTFAATGNMMAGRMGHTATLLQSGKVLVVGAKDTMVAELFDPTTGTFTPTGSMSVARTDHTATLLDSGKVLIAGGYAGGSGLASAEIYDPATEKFSATGNLTEARYEHAATVLSNRKANRLVLLVGGYVTATGLSNNEGLMTAELFDPTTGTFTATGSMSVHRAAPTATLLQTGSVLVSGGPDGFEGYFASDVLELYDPATGKFTTTGKLVEARTLHTATLLQTGAVLFAGGYQGGGGYGAYLDSSDLYSPAAGASAAGAMLADAREHHTATILFDGRVLIAGGDANGKSLASAELYRY